MKENSKTALSHSGKLTFRRRTFSKIFFKLSPELRPLETAFSDTDQSVGHEGSGPNVIKLFTAVSYDF